MHCQTLLIVDDNPENLKLIYLLLIQEGYVVQTVNSGEAAVAILTADTPDALLTDIQMPGMDGLQLTRLIRSHPRIGGIPILAISANAMRESIQEAYAAGCDSYITKPIDTRTFGQSVRTYLELAAARYSRCSWVKGMA
jgi:two-component system cell cycle response regulator DivK